MECSTARVEDIIARVESSLRGFQKSFKQIVSPTNFTPHAPFIYEKVGKIVLFTQFKFHSCRP